MPRIYVADSLNDVYSRIVGDLYCNFEHESAPRGQNVRENLATTLVLKNPLARVIGSKERDVNYGFAVGELCWYLSGENDLATMVYYNRRMEAFSDDGKTLRSAYGARIFNSIGDFPSQYEFALSELLNDNDSRRSLVHINSPDDLAVACTVGTKDVPCTLALQFFIRNKKLHLHTTMRSNDVIWGLPYDVFSFTVIQEAMVASLNDEGVDVTLGEYYHTAASLHLYDRHFKMAQKIMEEDEQEAITMDPIGSDGLQTLIAFEEDVRTGIHDDAGHVITLPSGSLGWMIENLIKHRRKRLAEISKEKDTR